MGGSLVAVSPDIHRGILSVTGMNYSTLLNRSVDWEGRYAVAFYENYRDPIERQVAFSLMQMLWDRGEANGYAHHMTTDPLENTPAHEVMLQVAFSDHQVTNVAAEVEARTIGAPVMTPGLASDRHWEMDPYFAGSATYPYEGSALIYWDSGNATPPNGNIPADQNGDPHSHPRNEPASSWQEAHFLLTGQMYDVCNGGYYLTREHPSNKASGTVSCREPEWAAGSGPARKENSHIALTDGSASTGQHSDETIFEAALTAASSGEAVAGAEVTFELSGADSSRTFTATLPPRYQGGHHDFEARFAGDDYFLGSSGQQRT